MAIRIRIRDDGPPASVQLAAAVRERIGNGDWLPGDRVPTVRGLAAEIGLAPNTVAKAYRELETGGWLVGRGRAGTFVADAPPVATTDADAALADAAHRYLRRAAQLGFDGAAASRVLDRVRQRA